MRAFFALVIALASALAGGCATALDGVALWAAASRTAPQPTFSEFADQGQNYSPPPETTGESEVVSAFATDLAPLTSGEDNAGAKAADRAKPTNQRRRKPVVIGGTKRVITGRARPAIEDGAAMASDGGSAVAAPTAPHATTSEGDAAAELKKTVAKKAVAKQTVAAGTVVDKKPAGAPAKTPAEPLVAKARPLRRVIQVKQPVGTPYAKTVQAELGDVPPSPDESFSIANDASSQPTIGQQEVTDQQDAPRRQVEIIDAPPDEYAGPFKPQEDESDVGRENRRLEDVPLDIRPTEGVMPTDVAAQEFEQKALADPRESHQVEETCCAYTPWTICFRPLYFENVAVERYGKRVPFFQSAICGAQFFTNVALLPYKMRLRPPRSCVCSNGFSRPGDCPPPGYGDLYWRWDAAVVEMAAVTGIVFILP